MAPITQRAVRQVGHASTGDRDVDAALNELRDALNRLVVVTLTTPTAELLGDGTILVNGVRIATLSSIPGTKALNIFNTDDETLNFERGTVRWTADQFEVVQQSGGTGGNRESFFGSRVNGSGQFSGMRTNPGGTEAVLFAFNNIRISVNNTGIGFYGTSPIAKPTVTGAKGGNAALGSLLTALANLGLITDSTTA